MKGIIFNLTEQVVVDHHGLDIWDVLLERAGVDGAYTAVGNYPDEELTAIVGAAAEVLDLPPVAVLRWVGRHSLPKLAERYPTFFGPSDARAFVLTLNEVIHPEVRKLYPGADAPEFAFEDLDTPGSLLVEYRSARRMCGLAEGLIQGAGDHYGEQVTITQETCMLDGDEACRLRCSFAPALVGSAPA